MIIKFRDHDGIWNWIDDVRRVRKLTDAKHSRSESPAIVIGDAEMHSLYIDLAIRDNDFQLYILNVKEAYLCNESTGSTVDVLQGPNG